MKKYTFNLDLIITVIVLFCLCISASIYQRLLYGNLHHDYLELQLKLLNTELELIDVKTKLVNSNN